MTQETGEVTATEADANVDEAAPTAEAPKPTETVDFWKSKAREQEKRAKANADAAAKLAEIEEAQKTEAQKTAERLADAERRAQAAERNAMRLQVIAETQLDPDLHEFVFGDSEDEMRSRAEKLKARSTSSTPTDEPPAKPASSRQGRADGVPPSGRELGREEARRRFGASAGASQ